MGNKAPQVTVYRSEFVVDCDEEFKINLPSEYFEFVDEDGDPLIYTCMCVVGNQTVELIACKNFISFDFRRKELVVYATSASRLAVDEANNQIYDVTDLRLIATDPFQYETYAPIRIIIQHRFPRANLNIASIEA